MFLLSTLKDTFKLSYSFFETDYLKRASNKTKLKNINSDLKNIPLFRLTYISSKSEFQDNS